MLYLCTLTSYSLLRLLMLEMCCQLSTKPTAVGSLPQYDFQPGICSWQAKMLLKSWAYGERRGIEETDSMATEPGAMESQHQSHQRPSTSINTSENRSIGPWVKSHPLGSHWDMLNLLFPVLQAITHASISCRNCTIHRQFAKHRQFTQQTTATRPEGAPWCVLKSASTVRTLLATRRATSTSRILKARQMGLSENVVYP